MNPLAVAFDIEGTLIMTAAPARRLREPLPGFPPRNGVLKERCPGLADP
jgi:hypothetical protein